MRIPSILKARLDRLAKRHGWDDLASFSEPGFVGELPLYSRYQEIAFLEEFDRDFADAVMVSYGLETIDLLVNRIAFTEPFLLALTLERAEPTWPMVPKLFLCHRTDCDKLGDHLLLGPPRGPFADRVLDIIGKREKSLQVLQDDVTDKSQPRLFVAHRHGRVDGQRTLDLLAKQHDSAGSRV
jgi:hypothetical protein